MVKTINLDFDILSHEFNLDHELEQFSDNIKIILNDNKSFFSISKKKSSCYLEFKKHDEKWEFFMSFKDPSTKNDYFINQNMTGSRQDILKSTVSLLIVFFLKNRMESQKVIDFMERL